MFCSPAAVVKPGSEPCNTRLTSATPLSLYITQYAARCTLSSTALPRSMLFFFWGLHDDDAHAHNTGALPEPPGARHSQPLRGSRVRMACCFIMIGVGCAVCYGTSAQLIALFPARYHAFFFVGTYSVSLVLSPVNAVIGELYSGGITATPAHSTTMSSCTSIHWGRLVLFYALGASC